MIQEIKYTTLSSDASDYTCADGELSAMANMVGEDGSLVPIAEATELFAVPDGTRQVFVHESASFDENIKRHYIFLIETEVQGTTVQELKWCTADDVQDGEVTALADVAAPDTVTGTILSVGTIGNVLVINTTDGIQYAIWRNGGYVYLGKRPSDITARVKVTNRRTESLGRDIAGSDIYLSGIVGDVRHGGVCDLSTFVKRAELCNLVLSGVNMCEKNAMEGGRFYYPFVIRLAWRLFDGTSLSCHTPPIIVNPIATGRPRIVITYFTDERVGGGRLDVSLSSVRVSLDVTADIGEWKELVQSLDIFMSPMAQGYTEDNDSMRYIYQGGGSEDTAEVDGAFGNDYEGVVRPYSAADFTNRQEMVFVMRRLDDKTAADVIASESRLYLVKSVPVEEIGDSVTTIDLKPSLDTMQSLAAREAMTDTQATRRSIVASCMYSYNSRLTIGVGGFMEDAPQLMSCIPSALSFGQLGAIRNMQVEIEEDGTAKLIETDYVPYSCRPENLTWLFTERKDAKAVWVTVSDLEAYRIPLRKHEMLNGSYAFNDFKTVTEGNQTSAIPPSIGEPGYQDGGSEILLSEAGNPFFFPVANTVSVGVGKVMALRAAVKAMSTSQFGEYPVYALATDGTWAIYVASDGRFGQVRLVTPDICINALTVAQMDSAVIFATARGLMMLSGSTATCISDAIRTSKAFKVTDLPGGDMFISAANTGEDVVTYGSFADFIKDCRVAYDYVRQRIIVFNPTKEDGERKYSYAYVYSLRGKSWGILATNAESVINTYGNLLITTDNGNVATGDTENVTDINGLVMTRPCKLGYPDKKKTVRTIIQRGVFDLTQIDGSILYGSNDLHSWYLVASSKTHILGGITGSPYKYFRVGVIAHLNEGDSLYGCTVEFDVKQDNKLR